METHAFIQPDNGFDECALTNCGLPARAGIHLIEPEHIIDKRLEITMGENGINIKLEGGMFDPSELALLSIIIGDMARTALAETARANSAAVRDHLGKGGKPRGN